ADRTDGNGPGYQTVSRPARVRLPLDIGLPVVEVVLDAGDHLDATEAFRVPGGDHRPEEPEDAECLILHDEVLGLLPQTDCLGIVRRERSELIGDRVDSRVGVVAQVDSAARIELAGGMNNAVLF